MFTMKYIVYTWGAYKVEIKLWFEGFIRVYIVILRILDKFTNF